MTAESRAEKVRIVACWRPPARPKIPLRITRNALFLFELPRDFRRLPKVSNYREPTVYGAARIDTLLTTTRRRPVT